MLCTNLSLCIKFRNHLYSKSLINVTAISYGENDNFGKNTPFPFPSIVP